MMAKKIQYNWGYLNKGKKFDTACNSKYVVGSADNFSLAVSVISAIIFLVVFIIIALNLKIDSLFKNFFISVIGAALTTAMFSILQNFIPKHITTIQVKDFDKSLLKIALENNTLEELCDWDYSGKDDKYNSFFQKIDARYQEALALGLEDVANTMVAIFKIKLPEYNSYEGQAYVEIIKKCGQQVVDEVKKRNKTAEDEKKDLAMGKVKLQIEAQKPGLQINDGSYTWNPKEVVNVGELR